VNGRGYLSEARFHWSFIFIRRYMIREWEGLSCSEFVFIGSLLSGRYRTREREVLHYRPQ